jgi:hypothetical protein
MVMSIQMTYLLLCTFIFTLIIQIVLSDQTELSSDSKILSNKAAQRLKRRRLAEDIIENSKNAGDVSLESTDNGMHQNGFHKKASRTAGGQGDQGHVLNSIHDNGFFSPSNGTDIITHPIAVIKCANQTLCVSPKLQLQEMYDVYYCKHLGHGVRFYFLVKEGLLLHPNIRLVDDINKAQVIVYLPVSAPWEKSECSDLKFKSKTIVLDEGDGQQLFEPHGACNKVSHNISFYGLGPVRQFSHYNEKCVSYIRERVCSSGVDSS